MTVALREKWAYDFLRLLRRYMRLPARQYKSLSCFTDATFGGIAWIKYLTVKNRIDCGVGPRGPAPQSGSNGEGEPAKSVLTV